MPEQEKAFLTAFSYVLAPAMVLYTEWVLKCALADGKKRLYFLARDGYLMYEAAKELCRIQEISMDCRYLYCSRTALRRGEMKILGEKALDYVLLGGYRVTLEKLFLRAGFDREEAGKAAKELGASDRLCERLSYEQIKAMRPLLVQSSFFIEKLQEKGEEAYPLVTGYLRQEGLLEDIPYGIVDSGWTGSIQKSLQSLLKAEGYPGETDGYYFGMYEYGSGMERERYHAYYFRPEGGMRRKAHFCNNLFECIFSSPEGMTRGYEKTDKGYVPVTEGKESPNRSRIEQSRELLLFYLKLYEEEQKAERPAHRKGREETADRRTSRQETRVLERLFASFMGHPDREEAECFGGYFFDDDVTGEEISPVAGRVTEGMLKENRIGRLVLRYLKDKKHPMLLSAWPEGSIVESGIDVERNLWNTVIYKYLLYTRKELEQSRKSRSRAKAEAAETEADKGRSGRNRGGQRQKCRSRDGQA